jgi:hypothetical protein
LEVHFIKNDFIGNRHSARRRRNRVSAQSVNLTGVMAVARFNAPC